MIEEIKQILNRGVALNHFPGGQFCIIKDNQISCDFVGYKSLFPEKILNQGDEIYDIASLSKVISTNTMVFKLIEQGRLSLQTKVRAILSDYSNDDTTIEDLLIHSSGLAADIKRANTLKNRDEVVEKVFQSKLIYPKGSNIVYSDVGFILLGLIIEKIEQLPLSEVADSMIFKPLAMNDTSYHPLKSLCAPTELREDSVYKGYLQGLVHDEKSFAMGGLAGHAGVFSTANDIAKFVLAMFMDKHILSSNTIASLNLTKIEANDLSGNPKARALGFEKPSPNHVLKDYKDELIIHTGFTGCNLMINLKRKEGFVLLTNAVHPKRDLNNIFGYRDEIYRLFIKQWEEQQ